MDIALAIGIVGMFLILLAFVLNQLNVWKNDDLIYDATNFAGSVMLVYYAVIGNALPFIILNAVWAAFSFRDIVLDVFRMARNKSS